MDDNPSIWERLVKGPPGTILGVIIVLIFLAVVGSVLKDCYRGGCWERCLQECEIKGWEDCEAWCASECID